MTTPTKQHDSDANRQTSERERTHGENCYLWDRHHYECALREIERLRAENEALRTVTDDDVHACEFARVDDTVSTDWPGPSEWELRKMRAALQSFIRSKGARRG